MAQTTWFHTELAAVSYWSFLAGQGCKFTELIIDPEAEQWGVVFEQLGNLNVSEAYDHNRHLGLVLYNAKAKAQAEHVAGDDFDTIYELFIGNRRT